MARIPAAELERLKREVSIQRLVEAKGVKLRRHGEDLIGLCPLHNDTEPSLVVSPKSNLWNCLGACGKGGSVIDWVMCAEGVSFRHAVEILRDGMPVAGENSAATAPPKQAPPKQTSVQKVESVLDVGLSDEELLLQVVEYYHQTLLENDEALAYLEKRGLRDEEMIRRFRLGLANRTLGYRLPAKNRKAGAELRGRLQKLGILRKSGHEHFNGSLVIPVLGSEGMVSTLYGRKIGGRLRAGTPMHLYLSGAARAVWNLEALASSKEVILCESLIDALSFWVNGFRNVTTSYGANGFSASHLEAFEAYGISQVLIAYDRDAAGEKASSKHAAQLMDRGIGCYRVQFPKGMDANEYVVQVSPAQQSLDLVLRKAVWMGDGEGPLRRPPGAVVMTTSSRVAPVERAQAPVKQQAAKEEEEQVSLEPPSSPASSLGPEQPQVEAPALLVPQAPAIEIPAEVRDGEVVITLGDRRYRVRGLERNTSLDVLKVNLLGSRGESFHVDTLDLYSAPKRGSFTKLLSSELGVSLETAKKDLGRVLLKLEELQDAAIQEALQKKEPAVLMTVDEQDAALKHLERPGLMERTREHLEACGVVGEDTNKLLVYLACVSRKLEKPLAVLIQSSSAAGKSALMDAVLQMVPEEECVAYSAMTGQSLYYMSEQNLSHKVLAIAEGEGMERASYALKLLQSEGKVSIASTGKDPVTGKLTTHEYTVEGPSAIVTTSTQIDLDEEFANRCLVLSIDESREQTEAIHAYQRSAETLEGLALRERRKALRTLHQNAQRMLRPLQVINPFADQLRFPSTSMLARRDHGKYLALIRTIALLHQHQREVLRYEVGGVEREVIEVEASDVALANELAEEVLGRTLDEMPPQTQHLLKEIHEYVVQRCGDGGIDRSEVRLSRRELREALGVGNTQLHMHLGRLVDLEYLLVHRGMRGQSYVYELMWDGQGMDGESFVMSLLDPATLGGQSSGREATDAAQTNGYDAGFSGVKVKFSGPFRPHFGGDSGPFRGSKNGHQAPDLQGVAGIEVAKSPNSTVGDFEGACVVTEARRSDTRPVGGG